MNIFDLIAQSQHGAYAFHDALKGGFHHIDVVLLRKEKANGPLQCDLVDDDVPGGSTVDLPEHDGNGAHGVILPGLQDLYGFHDLGGAQGGVNAFVGEVGVAGLSDELQDKLLRIADNGAAAEADLAGVDHLGEVHRESGICGRVLQHTFPDHVQSPSDLLVGLEDQPHTTAEGVPVAAEELTHHQSHRHVSIMAAGVHHPRRLGGVAQMRVLRDGQGIHVGPQDHCFAPAPFPVECSHHAGLGNVLHAVASNGLQIVINDLGGAELFISQLRMFMEIPPKGKDLCPVTLDFFPQ